MEIASTEPSESSNRDGERRPVLSINDDPHTLRGVGIPLTEAGKEDTAFTIVSSLFSKVRSTFTVPSTNGVSSSTTGGTGSTSQASPAAVVEQPAVNSSYSSRKGPTGTTKPVVSFASVLEQEKRKAKTFAIHSSNPIPPIISTPPIKALASGRRSTSAGQLLKRLTGQGLSREYWANDEICTECYACESVFSTWRRKHHCRICGQIFCSICASNFIKVSRFGAEGMLRVCNLCLQRLEKDDDDEDDRRSVLSVSTNFPAHQLGLMHTEHHDASIYSTMYGGLTGHAEARHLYSVGEMGRKSSLSASSSASRPSSAAFVEIAQDQYRQGFAASHSAHPPFGRQLVEDNRAPVKPREALNSAPPSSAVRTNLVAAPVDLPFTLPGPSSIVFPGSPSWSEGLCSPALLRSRFNSLAKEYDPIAGSVNSRWILTGNLGKPGWRTSRKRSEGPLELNAASMHHLHTMLRQMLVKEQIPDQDEWEETLLEIGLKVATHVESSSCGFATDAGRDVKIKKLPGGTPRDSEYVDGAVITKNLAHHQMPQDIRQPRIMLVSFPFDDNSLDRHRRSIDPPSLQEEEYLKNLTARVAARRPDVLLVEGPVSRETMEYLLERKIAVAGPVKPKATQFVSRVTECEVVSLGQLTVEPKLGYCSRFQLQTIEHTLIPEGRKTFMRFEGCSKETGCTIILRGGDMGTLKKVKNIASCVVLIARNLKMETYLWKDQALMLPPLTAEAAPDPFRPRVLSSSSMYTPSALRPPHNRRSSHTHKSVTFGTSIRSRRSRFSFHSIPSNTLDEDCDEESLDEDARQRRLSHKIQAAINPYLSTFVSASATLRFPPPYPIRRMKELDDSLGRAKKEWQEAEAVMLEEESQRQKADLEATATSALDITLIAPESNDITPPMNIGLPSKDPSASPGNGPEGLPPTGGAYALLKSAGEAPEHDDKPMAAITPMSIFPRSTSGSFFDPYRSVTSETSLIISVLSSHQASENRYLLPPELLDLKEVSCIAQASQLAALRFEQGEMQWLWEWYLRKNKDDLIVKHYQKIAILTSTVPAVELDLKSPCIAPALEYMTFYGENDRSLGQAVEEACLNAVANLPCELKTCKVPYIQHSQIYTHNESRIIISTQPWPPGTESKMVFTSPLDIVTFSFCRTCGKNSPYITMTEEAKRYSFAKLLELHFYPADVRLLRGAGCSHNIYLHHIRYFAMDNGMAMQMQTDSVKVFEIAFPPTRIHLKLEGLLELKNKDFAEMDKRNEEYWNSVDALVKQWELYVGGQADIAAQERGTPPLGTAVMELHGRLGPDRKEITDLIRTAYAESTPTDTLAAGPIKVAIQNKVVFYDNEFDRLERIYLATESELKVTGATYDFINGGTTSASSKAEVKMIDNIPDADRDVGEDRRKLSSEADAEHEGNQTGKREGSPDQQSLTDLAPEDAQEPPEPEPFKNPEPTPVGFKRGDKNLDLTSPFVGRLSPLEPQRRVPLAATSRAEIITSRPTSPVLDLTPIPQISSLYQPNHLESGYSVIGTGERPSVINTMFGYSGFSRMREATRSFVPLKYPALPSEHLFEDTSIVVREDEPTSIIAFTLQSPVYLATLTKTKAAIKVSNRSEASIPDNDGAVSVPQSWGIANLDGMSDAVNEVEVLPATTHSVFHFESGGVQISCTVFHAEQFDALRRNCFCDQSMIESLARCAKWDASGGKSTFMKTRDDRFLAKEVSRNELDATLKFAPGYFQYMSDAISSKRPTVLTKIFGLYNIVYKNQVLGKSVRMTLLVMENLFYDHEVYQVYDLKGSLRNRLAPVTSSNPHQILLDENLVNNLHSAPLYIREHSKRILRSALSRDSRFLEDLNVMAYSLLVAVDESKKEIIVGMINYARTYTWDRKLESWVKESTFLGGAGKGEPTIVTPKQYRTRFLNAMERYFSLVPDRWMKTTYTSEEDTVKEDW